jgi:hypothetical protein
VETYWIVAGTYEGVVISVSVSLVGVKSVGGFNKGPDAIQCTISSTEDKCSSPEDVCVYMRV